MIASMFIGGLPCDVGRREWAWFDIQKLGGCRETADERMALRNESSPAGTQIPSKNLWSSVRKHDRSFR